MVTCMSHKRYCLSISMNSFHWLMSFALTNMKQKHGLDNHLLGVASTTLGGSRATFSIDIPKVDAIFTGTGDLFASLFLAWFTLTEHNVKETLERTIATVQSVLERTSSSFSVKDSSAKLSSKERELKLIQSKCDIENPKVKIQAKPIIST
uniref:pyridoxal kinase n=1 Tax=Cacopsylla melanoneura TaxID=428564 RepID=A0A8D8VD55_9HEMI